MKHRTQILLDPGQYDFLRSLSHREGKGLGEMIRGFIDEKRQVFSRKKTKDPLLKFVGSFSDKECHSENFKDFLYKKDES